MIYLELFIAFRLIRKSSEEFEEVRNQPAFMEKRK
jgi:hypothetical protein